MARKKTPEEYYNECKNKGYDLPLENYVNNRTKIKHKCKKGHIYEQVPNAHLNGVGCPLCKGTPKKTPKEYYNECKEKDLDLPIEDYRDARTKIKHKCKKGHVYEQTPNDHLNGHGCKVCQYQTINRQSLESFKDRILSKFDNLEVLNIWRDCDTDSNTTSQGVWALLRCLRHNLTYTASVYDLLIRERSNHCIKCANENRVEKREGKTAKKTSKEYYNECKYKGYDLPIEDYVNNSTKIKHKCKKGHIYIQIPNAHLNGAGCPVCNESRGERFIRNYLDKHNIKYEPQKTFEDLKDKDYLSYDFYLPDYNTLIEYQGIQHYEPKEYFGGEETYKTQLLHDNLKREYAKNNGYKLLELHYTLDTQDKTDKYLDIELLNSYNPLVALLNKLGLSYDMLEDNIYHIKGTSILLKSRTINERHIKCLNDPNYYFNLHIKYRNKGYKLVFIDSFMLDKPTLDTFTIPFLLLCTRGKAEHTLYGRQVVCKEVTKKRDKTILRDFVSKYHLQGNTGAKYYYGFYTKKDNKLVGVMSFGKNLNPKYKNDNSLIELKRMVWLPNYQIRYGVSKGIKTFLREHPEYTKVLSYSLNDISNGNVYKQSGFKFISDVKPSKRYVNPNDEQDNYSFQINSTWGFSTGVVAKNVHPYSKEQSKSAKFREQVIETLLPHRTDDEKGYIPFVDSGNATWLYI